MNELIALLDGDEVGRVTNEAGRLTFRYFEKWQAAPGAYPISTSMPLLIEKHRNSKIEPFLWGLLPDNEQVLNRWAQRFQVSARSAFALISNVGEDCAGAIQFVTPDNLHRFTGPDGTGEVNWLSNAEIARRLIELKNDVGAGRIARDTGQFSLAGAQPKTAFYKEGERWGIPSGRVPTTHIIKPPTGEFDGFAENEHVCLSVARAVGMPAAKSEILSFEGELAIVVERYDRRRSQSGKVLRIHQEDFCQALSVSPAKKYQNQGGPGPEKIIMHLRSNIPKAEDRDVDIARFRDALIFNWLIAGTDAHAKNYSILIGARGAVRLAPLYDLISLLPYSDQNPLRSKLAMKIGDAYKLDKITGAEWIDFSRRNQLRSDEVIDRIRLLSRRLPDAFSDEIRKMRGDGLDHKILNELQNAVYQRCQRVSRTFDHP